MLADDLAGCVMAAREGDRHAFARLYARHARLVRGVLMVRYGPADLDDLVHDVFARALEHLHQLREPTAFGPWLVQIARREAMRERRRLRVQPLVHEPASIDAPRAEAERVLERIRSLPECYAEPLVLRLVFGMSGAEIARELGLSPGYVRVNLHRGMAKLRRLLEPGAR